MADEEQDDSQKTEEPTQKRLDDAFKRGSVPFSREVTSFLMLLVFSFTIISMLPFMMKETLHNLTRYIEKPHLFSFEPQNVLSLSESAILENAGGYGNSCIDYYNSHNFISHFAAWVCAFGG